jgi:hypothetical protein
MHDHSFPVVRALVFGLVLSVAHSALSFLLLACAVSAGYLPALVGFWILEFPLIVSVPDLFSKPHPVAWWLNSLAYGLIIAWVGYSARWIRHRKHVTFWELRLGAALIAFALIALLLGELYHPVTGPADARSEAQALQSAAANDATAENLRKRVVSHERLAAEVPKLPSIRALHTKLAREEFLKVQQEESRARFHRAQAAYYGFLAIRSGTRYPALILLGLGVLLEWIRLRRRRRARSGLLASQQTGGVSSYWAP